LVTGKFVLCIVRSHQFPNLAPIFKLLRMQYVFLAMAILTIVAFIQYRRNNKR
jgi:hypothetical protein